jgi:hypothetical protein
MKVRDLRRSGTFSVAISAIMAIGAGCWMQFRSGQGAKQNDALPTPRRVVSIPGYINATDQAEVAKVPLTMALHRHCADNHEHTKRRSGSAHDEPGSKVPHHSP